ncbi:response regulator transcription factor [Herbiconiux sp. VKM Ac-1786]|uniref:response regulator n=1 Tax=Herbiconiux sp. VKM Ac-1786 TaxID=2783824 RepID=UPI00188BA849|nr:response regulator transcription factor [Herbiconiux sp. VKM Ac-1786]MBF4573956.1 response regulator transcription factor [Herbiconiux sp. VKM Ac-1786]
MARDVVRIAIVDDHRMLLTALTEWIKSAADDIACVAAVTTWPELLAHPQFPVDVVLLDLDLKDNLPVSIKLRALDTAGVKTVMMSTYSEPAVVREALAAGAHGYIVKSEGAETIVVAIRLALAGSRFVSPLVGLQLDAAPALAKLSAQERRVMALYGSGESAKRIATVLQITEQTAKSHLKRLRAKYRLAGIDVGSKVALRNQAIRDGLILLDDTGRTPTAATATPADADVDGDDLDLEAIDALAATEDLDDLDADPAARR